MSSPLNLYASPSGCSAVLLPFDLAEIVEDWSKLRVMMARNMPESYTRDEWAYLISFLEPGNLVKPFVQSFGNPERGGTAGIFRVLRPRGSVGVWLPGNVSLLGPLTLILLSLTGNRLRLKGATGAADLTGVFLEFARTNLPDGALRAHLAAHVEYDVFDRGDVRNRDMAGAVQVRIVFGSDEAVQAIHALDHPVDSLGFSFADRRSEAWIQLDAVSDALLTDLIKVFAIYGLAGCTSPHRVLVLDATPNEVLTVRDRMRAIWTAVIRRDPAPHLASENVMSRQCAAALGWDAVLAPRNGAVLACGSTRLGLIPGRMALTFSPATIDEAIDTLPANIQTIGYGFSAVPLETSWFNVLGRTQVKRMVPIARMHQFGPVWDGLAFWSQSFEEIEVQQ